MDDLGFIVGGRVNMDLFYRYIVDIKRKLRTGNGIFQSPDLDDFKTAAAGYEAAPLENYLIFPDFHRIWAERYTRMLVQINLPSQFRLVGQGVPLLDPTALAKALGSKEKSEVKFPDIFDEIQGKPAQPGDPPPPTIQDVMAGPSDKTLKYFEKYMSDVNPMDPEVIDKLKSIVSAPAATPNKKFPNPQLARYGYDDRRNFEKNFYESQIKTHEALMAIAPGLFPTALTELASGAGCNTVLKTIYETAKSSQPESLPTSQFEIAAQEILLQHQVRLQFAILFGMNLGSGAILDALVKTPENAGGVGLVDPSQTAQSIIDAYRQTIKTNNNDSTSNSRGETSNDQTTQGSLNNNTAQSSPATAPSTEQQKQSSGINSTTTEDTSYPQKDPGTDAGQNASTAANGGTETSSTATQNAEIKQVNNEHTNQQDPQSSQGSSGQPTSVGQDDVERDEDGNPIPYPTPRVVEEDTTPPELPPHVTGMKSWNDLVIAEKKETAATTDEDDEKTESQEVGLAASIRNSKVRQRARFVIQGSLGPTPREKDYPNLTGTAQNPTFRGFVGGVCNPSWYPGPPGTQPPSPGSGYDSKQSFENNILSANPDNTVQAIATSCGQYAGWLLCNVIFDTDHPFAKVNLRYPVTSENDAKARAAGFPFPGSAVSAGKSDYIVGAPGFANLGYFAAGVGAWRNSDVGRGGVTEEQCKKMSPKYGDVFLIRDAQNVRHAGVFVDWLPAGEGGTGTCITADAGVSNINVLFRNWASGKSKEQIRSSLSEAAQQILPQASEGMCYSARKLVYKSGQGWNIQGQVDQGDQNLWRIVMGWIDLDLLIPALVKYYGESYPKPAEYP